MKKIYILFISLALVAMNPAAAAAAQKNANQGEKKLAQPSGTYLFAQKGGEDLFLDIYDPAEGSETTLDGKQKPTVLYVFGGGFKEGKRDSKAAREWFAALNAEGYKVVSIDYRLGMKGKSFSRNPLKNFKITKEAVDIAVEDLFSATAFIIDNSEELGIDPNAIVLSGSSAGAITVLQGEWEACNRSVRAEASLPQGYHYAGVISFAGAILTGDGSIRYAVEPAPTMLLHGTADKLVVYNQIKVLKIHFSGSDALARIMKKNSYNYNILRYADRGHEVATAMMNALPEELRFLETNVIRGEKRIVDLTLDDPDLISFDKSWTPSTIYKKGAPTAGDD
ncbi:MAG: alpha/beta hydrolase [Bacteroidales bacterium]|nr:alpha/beta hydrolase [Bacteroidales bacterium]